MLNQGGDMKMNFLQLSGHLSVCRYFIFLLLVQIHLVNFNQTWHNVFWFKRYEKYFDDIRKLFSPEQLDQYPIFAKATYVKEHASWVNDMSCLFSLPKLKAQVSFSDDLSSVVRPSVCNLFTFSTSSPEPLSQFQRNLAQ